MDATWKLERVSRSLSKRLKAEIGKTHSAASSVICLTSHPVARRLERIRVYAWTELRPRGPQERKSFISLHVFCC